MKTKCFPVAAILIALALIFSGCGDGGGGGSDETQNFLGDEHDDKIVDAEPDGEPNGDGAGDEVSSSSEEASSSSIAVAEPPSSSSLEISSSSSEIAASSSSGKAAGADVSGKPVATAKTDTSITVGALATAAGQAVEYAISESQTVPSSAGYWQSERTFKGLNLGTTYYVFARSAENANYSADTAQMSDPITTLTPPKDPEICGDRTEEPFDPDLYECRAGSKIYLKEKPKDKGGREYEAVLIGTQTWIAENMKLAAEGSVCYEDDCETYGRLYDLETAKGVCPEGWHLPTRDEWATLNTFLGGGTQEALKLKDVNWFSCRFAGCESISTDAYGFKALPSGFYTTSLGGGDAAYWWTSTTIDGKGAYTLITNIYGNNSIGLTSTASNTYKLGVRCVMNNP